MKVVAKALRGLINFLAGEKLLDWLKLPNGGTMVFLRSLWVTVEVYVIALWLRSLFHARWPLEFEFGQLFNNLPDTLPWVGAIFAFAYVALYARFSSQWAYLAGFYNQLMATQAQIVGTAPTLAQRDANANPKIQLWKAAFVEDAQDLHLATKKMFSLTVWFMLEQPEVFDSFVTYTAGGADRLKELVNDLKDAVGEDKLKAMRASDELLRGERPPVKSSHQLALIPRSRRPAPRRPAGAPLAGSRLRLGRSVRGQPTPPASSSEWPELDWLIC